jgi:hypothetical protein
MLISIDRFLQRTVFIPARYFSSNPSDPLHRMLWGLQHSRGADVSIIWNRRRCQLGIRISRGDLDPRTFRELLASQVEPTVRQYKDEKDKAA